MLGNYLLDLLLNTFLGGQVVMIVETEQHLVCHLAHFLLPKLTNHLLKDFIY